jgi:hypothetical protein
MDDRPLYAPDHKIPPRQPVPGVPLFSFRTTDHRQVDCELRSHGDFGWEAQFFIDGSFSTSRRLDTREGAVQWAEAERRAIERDPDWP